MNRFEGKKVFLTGAASGVGKATHALFRAEGADVVAVDLNPAPDVIACDVTESPAIVAIVTSTVPFAALHKEAGSSTVAHQTEVKMEG